LENVNCDNILLYLQRLLYVDMGYIVRVIMTANWLYYALFS